MARKKQLTEVSLRPIADAIQKAQDGLKKLAEEAPPNKSDVIKAKVEALDIVHVQVQILCRGAKIKPYGFCRVLKRSKINPPYGVSIEDC